MPDQGVPAHDMEAEAAVLSSVMIDPSAYDRVATMIRPESFYSEANRRTFEACGELRAVGQPVDVVQVGTWLRDRDRLGQIGGMAYLTELLNAAPAVVNVESYAKIVANKAQQRKLAWIARRIMVEAYEPCDDVQALIDRSERAVYELAREIRANKPPDTMRKATERVFQKLMEASKRVGTGPTGITSGLSALDDATGGFQSGEQTIIAARPAMGKTSLAMGIAGHVNRRDYGVVVFSLEMPNEQIATRALCSDARVDVRKVRNNAFDPNDWRLLTASAAALSKANPHFYLEEDSVGLMEMRSIVRQRQSEMERDNCKLGLVVVDYLQLMKGREGVKNREEAVSENARGLKILAKETRTSMLVLSQLNRAVESRTDKRPVLSDLRESGAIEEAGDCVIGMYRDDYYNEDSKTPGVVELVLLKFRHGPCGTVDVGFEAKSTSFYNLRTDAANWSDGAP